jgi:hypothetical protein
MTISGSGRRLPRTRVLECSVSGCKHEGSKGFPESPLELFCSECYDRVRTLRFLRVIEP